MGAAEPSWHERLTPVEVAQVTALVTAATQADGVAPLSEHVLLHLSHGGDLGAANAMCRHSDGTLVGYAHLDSTDPVAGASGELLVDPGARRHGVGSTLVAAMLARSTDGRLRLWAHGHQPAAEAFAERSGFRRSRLLWQMRRSLHAPLPPPRWPDGVTVRTFLPGTDEQGWTALNSRAFADHPEQGRWTVDDLRQREGEPWFDPLGFFLAERRTEAGDSELVGFHWTKVHGGQHRHTHDGEPIHEHPHHHPPIGEVYVVGVEPTAAGAGLGEALTLHGLHHLRGLGLAQVLLYVDDDNRRALALYERLGFARWDSDVTYARA